jgi:hypothetical protein
MGLQEKIQAFIACRAPQPVCDACVADHLSLQRRQVAAATARILSGDRYRRFSGRCCGCCTTRRVTASAISHA